MVWPLCTTVPMRDKVEKIARLTGDPVPAWKAEGDPFSATDLTYDDVTLTARTIGSIVVFSLEYAQDAIGGPAAIEDAIAAAMARSVDEAILFGQLAAGDEPQAGNMASPCPLGVLQNLLTNLPGNVLGGDAAGTTQTATTMYREIQQLLYKMYRANEGVSAIVSNDALREVYVDAYDSTGQPNGLALGRFSVIYATPPCVITPRSPFQASCAVLEHLWLTRPYVPKARTLTGQPLRMPDNIARIQWNTTNMIESFTRGAMTDVATDVFAGDWSQVLVGSRMSIQLRTLGERYAESGQLAILAAGRFDVQLARPAAMAAFRYLKGAA